ncbi:hypothetical protein [Streptomyces sp. NPDC102360]|uniref:hypothetical protein n=1 Tax=Streptomyces sp. NPDC102360 TaxID=3366160 RepID=UPI00380569AA
MIAKPATVDADSLRALGEPTTSAPCWPAPSATGRSWRCSPGAGLGDLFAFANAVATMTGGVTSIVDPAGRVPAFSNLADQPVDEQRRRATLLVSEVCSPATDPDHRPS